MKKIKILIICLLSNAMAEDLFQPLHAQVTNSKFASFNTNISMHKILNSWAIATHKNIIVKNIPNSSLILTTENLEWHSLISKLCQLFELKISKKDNIYTLTKNTQYISKYKIRYIGADKIYELKNHIKKVCKACSISLDKTNNIIWISAPKQWLTAIKSSIKAIDNPEVLINIRIRLIKVEHKWFNNWGKAWSKEHNLPETWLENLLNPAAAIKHIVLNPILTNQFIEHLLQISKTNTTATLISESNLKILNNHTSSLQSGIIMPFYTKDSRGRIQTLFKPIVLSIKATPEAMVKPWIKIHLLLNYEQKANSGEIITTSLSSDIKTQNKQTIILSSLNTHLYNNTMQNNIFSKIPWLGNILKYKATNQENSLLLFVINAGY